MKACSLDLRERVAQACQEGLESRRETAERFGVSVSFVKKLMRRLRQTGSLAVKPHRGGRQPALDTRGREVLGELVRQQPDATLKELQRQLQKRTGKTVSTSALDRHLRALELPRKKSPCMPANNRRRGCRNCVGSFKGRFRRFRPRSWFLWMKAGPPRA